MADTALAKNVIFPKQHQHSHTGIHFLRSTNYLKSPRILQGRAPMQCDTTSLQPSQILVHIGKLSFNLILSQCLQCFDAAGLAAGRASSL